MATNAALIATMQPAVQLHGRSSDLGSERPVDLVHLARQTCGNKDLETEVLGLFVRQSRTQLERIALAQSATDCFEAAHRLKGSARAIGATSVADCAEAIELAVTAGTEFAAPLADLTRAVTIANSFIADLID
jgi:HPt (histidine-containing phosphotransfer) domain-containing protein